MQKYALLTFDIVTRDAQNIFKMFLLDFEIVEKNMHLHISWPYVIILTLLVYNLFNIYIYR